MARVKIIPPDRFHFSSSLDIRITDINYGGHAGNDAILSMIHEARIRFLSHYGYSELNMAGVGLIMGDVAIEFKAELFYGEKVEMKVAAVEFSRVGFELIYQLEKIENGKTVIAVLAKTGMICFDYTKRKVVAVPEEVKLKMENK